MKHFLLTALVATTLFSGCKKDNQSNDNLKPTADFSYAGNGTAPSDVTFTNKSSNTYSYKWDFGDNSTSTERSPMHTYKKGGVYTVSLTATGGGGTNTSTKTVNIISPTSVKITAITVVSTPFTDANGSGWDNNSGPDLRYSITDANDNPLVLSPTYYPDVVAASLPLRFTLNPAFQVTNFTTTYKVKLWDYDNNDVPPNPDDFISGYQFNFSGFAATGYPTTATLFTTGSNLKIELTLQWQ